MRSALRRAWKLAFIAFLELAVAAMPLHAARMTHSVGHGPTKFSSHHDCERDKGATDRVTPLDATAKAAGSAPKLIATCTPRHRASCCCPVCYISAGTVVSTIIDPDFVEGTRDPVVPVVLVQPHLEDIFRPPKHA